MRATSFSAAALAATAWLLAGCTIAQMQDENARAARQVQAKEAELAREQQRQTELQAEGRRLEDDLRSRELTLSEMARRLETMRRLNAATATATAEQRQQKARREKALTDASAQVQALERAPATTPEAKARRLEEVRRELRRTLELIAAT